MAEANIKKLNIIIETNADEAAKKISDFKGAISELKKTSKNTTKETKSFGKDLEKNTDTTKATKKIDNFSKSMAKIAVSAYAFKRIGDFIGSAITESNAFIENMNLFTVSMGSAVDQAQEFVDTVSEAVGIDPSEMMRNVGMFQRLSTGFGIASDEAYKMSKNLTQLGYDMSSFFNLPIEESMTKLQSGIAGKIICLVLMGVNTVIYLIAGNSKHVMV